MLPCSIPSMVRAPWKPDRIFSLIFCFNLLVLFLVLFFSYKQHNNNASSPTDLSLSLVRPWSALLSPSVVDVYVPGLLVRGAKGGLFAVERVARASLAAVGVAAPSFLDVHHVLRFVRGAVLGHLARAPIHGVLGTPGALASG